MGWGTKEASERLGVSQTTLKRWVAHFPDVFPKNRLGHYLYTDAEMELLEAIKTQIRDGVPMEQVTLPEPPARAEERSREPEPPSSSAGTAERAGVPDSLKLRLEHLERMIDRKADEVVTAQLYQHRHELDELRAMVAQIADSLEKMRQAAAGLEAGRLSDSPFAAPRPEGNRPAQETRRKRFGLF